MMPIPSEIAHALVSELFDSPAVFKGMLGHWPCSAWDLHQWAERFGDQCIKFRVGPRVQMQKGPLWEADCEYVIATAKEFVDWVEQKCTIKESHAFYGLDPTETWGYADYKYMADMFEEDGDMLQMIDWSMFGLNNRSGRDSTIWMGSRGAHTPCHYDTYGYNIVAQVYGKKCWTLFPPSQSNLLLPTRIPYEESSVFSSVNLLDRDVLRIHQSLNVATPYSVCLEPGDILFVPHHWWHLVESLETSVSINTWVEMGLDDDCRTEEAICKTLVAIFAQTCKFDAVLLNPTEEPASYQKALFYLQSTLRRNISNELDSFPGNGAATLTSSKLPAPANETCNAALEPPMKRKHMEGDVEFVQQKRATKLSEILSRYSQHVQVLTSLPFVEYVAIRCAWHNVPAAADLPTKGEHEARGQASLCADSLKIASRAGSSKSKRGVDMCHQLNKADAQQRSDLASAASCVDPMLLREKYAEDRENPLSPDEESHSSSQSTSSSDTSNSDEETDFSQLLLNCVVHPSIVSEIAKLLTHQYRRTRLSKANQ